MFKSYHTSLSAPSMVRVCRATSPSLRAAPAAGQEDVAQAEQFLTARLGAGTNHVGGVGGGGDVACIAKGLGDIAQAHVMNLVARNSVVSRESFSKPCLEYGAGAFTRP